MPFDVVARLLHPLRTGPVTSGYPGKPPDLATAARGLPELDELRCDATAACVGACPTRAITVLDGVWRLDMGRCIFCGECARACPRDAIRLGPQIELAVREEAALIVEQAARRPAE